MPCRKAWWVLRSLDSKEEIFPASQRDRARASSAVTPSGVASRLFYLAAPWFVTALAFLLNPGMALPWQGKVVEVLHGDELRVLCGGHTERICLYGIDAPREPQPFGIDAKIYSARRVLGRIVDVEPVLHDLMDRIVARVTIDGASLNKELVAKGYAWWFRKQVPTDTELATLEDAARTARLGLWACPHPVPPWEFEPLLPAESAGPATEFGRWRRGMVSELLRSKVPAQRLFGKPGTIRRRLIGGPPGPRGIPAGFTVDDE